MRPSTQVLRTVVASCVVVSSALAGTPSLAQPTLDQQALAATLFKEARALLAADRIPEACRKLEESQRLDPSGGTLLNLAVCHEREGKTATAWVEFRDARIVADQAGRADRSVLADAHFRALEPRLSKLVIRVDPTVDVPGVEVRADSVEVRRAAWGTAIPVDPGDHVVQATAPGKKRATLFVTVAPNGDEKTIVIPPWKDAPIDATPPAALLTPVPIAPVAIPVGAPTPRRDRRAMFVAATVAGAGLAVGTFYGVRAFAKHAQSDDACTTSPCGPTSQDLNTSAKTAADVSTGAFAVGLVAIGFTAYFWLFDTTPRPPSGALEINPVLGPGRGTIDLAGTF